MPLDIKCPVTKIDSNRSGLRIAQEVCFKQLNDPSLDGGGLPIFRPFEPNSYSDFGGQPTYTARNPINASRQNKRGRITNREASGGFTQDLTPDFGWLMQGLLYANARSKPSSRSFYDDFSGRIGITSVESSSVTTVVPIPGLIAGHIVRFEGFGISANNGRRVIDAVTDNVYDTSGMTDEPSVPTDTAAMHVVGYKNGPDLCSVTATPGALPYITIDRDATQLGLVPGEWIYIGGDEADASFAAPVNNGFARIDHIDGNDIYLDKTDNTMVTDDGDGMRIELYLGAMIKNEKDPTLIKQMSYTLERSLGQDADAITQGELIKGAVPNELTLSLPTTDKLTVETTFVAAKADVYKDDGVDENYVTGTRPDIEQQHAFNSTSDIARFRLMTVNDTNANPQNRIGIVSEATLTINNNASGLNGIGQMGFFAVSAGQFDVGGDITVYFTDVDVMRLMQSGEVVTVDYAIVYNNTGYLFDVPGLSLSNGQANVEANSPITLPISTAAYESKFGNTLTCMQFLYLPDRAEVEF